MLSYNILTCEFCCAEIGVLVKHAGFWFTWFEPILGCNGPCYAPVKTDENWKSYVKLGRLKGSQCYSGVVRVSWRGCCTQQDYHGQSVFFMNLSVTKKPSFWIYKIRHCKLHIFLSPIVFCLTFLDPVPSEPVWIHNWISICQNLGIWEPLLCCLYNLSI